MLPSAFDRLSEYSSLQGFELPVVAKLKLEFAELSAPVPVPPPAPFRIDDDDGAGAFSKSALFPTKITVRLGLARARASARNVGSAAKLGCEVMSYTRSAPAAPR